MFILSFFQASFWPGAVLTIFLMVFFQPSHSVTGQGSAGVTVVGVVVAVGVGGGVGVGLDLGGASCSMDSATSIFTFLVFFLVFLTTTGAGVGASSSIDSATTFFTFLVFFFVFLTTTGAGVGASSSEVSGETLDSVSDSTGAAFLTGGLVLFLGALAFLWSGWPF